MVSHPQVLDRAAPAQSTVSVVSRRSHSGRRHRSGRSHHGSFSQPQNDFPIFTHTGDVEIVIRAGGQERRYLLHRLILAQCSGFFQASTSEVWSRQIAPPKPDYGTLSRISGSSSLSNGSTLAQSDNGTVQPERKRWRYELDWESKAEDEEPMLVQKKPSFSPGFGRDQRPPPSAMTKPSNTQTGFFRSMANLTGMQTTIHLPQGNMEDTMEPIIRDYENLFRLFYNYPPVVNSVNIATAYSECKALLALADMYDALPVTGPRVDHHLLGFGSRLFKQIAKYPPSYLKLGYLARSRVIFTEALIHVVGQWPAAAPHLRSDSYSLLPRTVHDLIEDKVDDLEDMKARVDSKLFRLTLTTSRGERVGPTNAYLDWLAVSLFRQWFVEMTTPPPAPILKNSSSSQPSPQPSASQPSSRVYRQIHTHNYLPHDDLKRFLKAHPTPTSDALYTREVLKRFERKMDEIKRLARDVVKPLMRNFLELDLKTPGGGGGREEAGLPYLTCTRIEEGDIPWSL